MAHTTFKLISTYEHVPDALRFDHLFRVEVFESVTRPDFYRCRIWSYRHYRLNVALDTGGLESHDVLAQDVSVLVEDTELLSGTRAASEDEFLRRAFIEVERLIQLLVV